MSIINKLFSSETFLFIFVKADLRISQFSPYRVIFYHSIASRSSKENEPKERAQAVQRIGQFFRYRVKSFTRLLRTTSFIQRIFATQNRNINSKLAPRLRQFLTNFYYYAVEKDLFSFSLALINIHRHLKYFLNLQVNCPLLDDQHQ